jgi:hypothetical protein
MVAVHEDSFVALPIDEDGLALIDSQHVALDAIGAEAISLVWPKPRDFNVTDHGVYHHPIVSPEVGGAAACSQTRSLVPDMGRRPTL